jgi:dTDP-4-amino-4,6-dideoxygalactose transaminase
MNTQAPIPVLVPFMPQIDAVLPYLQRIDASQRYTNFGPLCLELEARFRTLLATDGKEPYVCSAANATLGLEIALIALDLKPRAQVLMPALTFVATATSALRAGCEPVFGDVDLQTWQLTPALARRYCALHPIDCVMPVATYGTPLDIEAWDAFSRDTGIPVLIDAAGALGNQGLGKRCHIVYSLHATKAMSSVEGSMVASHDQGFIEGVRRLSNFGIDLDSGRIDIAGTNAKLSEYHAAVGLASLDVWGETQSKRREAWRQQRQMLTRQVPTLTWQQGSVGHVHTLMPVLVPDSTNSSAVRPALAKCGVETRAWYCPPLPQQPAFSRCRRLGDLSATYHIGQQLVGLPFHPQLTEAQLLHVADALAQVLRQAEGMV